MANWQHRLKLKDISEAYDRKEIDSKEAGKRTAERIKQLAEHLIPAYVSYKEEFLEIADQFEDVEDQDDYNHCLEQLVDEHIYVKMCRKLKSILALTRVVDIPFELGEPDPDVLPLKEKA